MVQNYSPKTFLRQTSNAILKKCFEREGALADVSWNELPEHQVDVVYDRWQDLPEFQRLTVERVFEDAEELANEEGLKVLVEEGQFHAEMAPPFVSDALDRMTRRLWYLYHDSGLYRFDAQPNLNRILVDREEMVRSEPEKVKDFAKATLNDLIGDATFRVYRYPEEDRDVADETRLSLVVLDLNQCVAEEAVPEGTDEFVCRILRQHGKGFRKHANTLIFLAPDQHRASEVIDAARRLLALRNIDDDKPTKKQLSEEQLKDLAARLKEAEARLPAALATAYPSSGREEDHPLL